MMLVPSVGQFRVFEHYDRFVHGLSGEEVSSSEMRVLRQRAIFAWKGLEKRKDVPEELIVRIIEFAGVGESTLMFFIMGKASADSLAKSNFSLFERVAQPDLGNLQSLTISRLREANALTVFPVFDERRLIPENQRPVHIGARPALSQLAINIFCATMQEGEVIEIANRIDPEFMKPSHFEYLKDRTYTFIKNYHNVISSVATGCAMLLTVYSVIFLTMACISILPILLFGQEGMFISLVIMLLIFFIKTCEIEVPILDEIGTYIMSITKQIVEAEVNFFENQSNLWKDYSTLKLNEYQNERLQKAMVVWERESLRLFRGN